jgi:hypothetical protein
MRHHLFHLLQKLRSGEFYSLPQLEKEGVGPISKLPLSIRAYAFCWNRFCAITMAKESRKRML